MPGQRPIQATSIRYGRWLDDSRDQYLAGGRSHTDWRGGGVPNDMVPHSPFSDDVPANDNFEDEEAAA